MPILHHSTTWLSLVYVEIEEEALICLNRLFPLLEILTFLLVDTPQDWKIDEERWIFWMIFLCVNGVFDCSYSVGLCLPKVALIPPFSLFWHVSVSLCSWLYLRWGLRPWLVWIPTGPRWWLRLAADQDLQLAAPDPRPPTRYSLDLNRTQTAYSASCTWRQHTV